MASFTNNLIIKELGYKQWEVCQAFAFITEEGDVIEVPKGFRCDLASVFRWFKSIVDTPSYWTQAAVVHDWLYDLHRKGSTRFTRKQADKILIQGMRAKEEEYKISWNLKRKSLVYAAVRVGGGPSWKPGFINRNNRIDEDT
jgi:hypothetical protein